MGGLPPIMRLKAIGAAGPKAIAEERGNRPSSPNSTLSAFRKAGRRLQQSTRAAVGSGRVCLCSHR